MVPLPMSAASAIWSTVTESSPCCENNWMAVDKMCARIAAFLRSRLSVIFLVTTVIYDHSHKLKGRDCQEAASAKAVPSVSLGEKGRSPANPDAGKIVCSVHGPGSKIIVGISSLRCMLSTGWPSRFISVNSNVRYHRANSRGGTVLSPEEPTIVIAFTRGGVRE